jgi:hypothetical protein
MAEAGEPNPSANPPTVNVGLQLMAGFEQVGQEFYVMVQLTTGCMTFRVSLPIAAAKHMSKVIRDAAETAEVQIIKPPSQIVGVNQA